MDMKPNPHSLYIKENHQHNYKIGHYIIDIGKNRRKIIIITFTFYSLSIYIKENYQHNYKIEHLILLTLGKNRKKSLFRFIITFTFYYFSLDF